MSQTTPATGTDHATTTAEPPRSVRPRRKLAGNAPYRGKVQPRRAR